MSASPFDRPTRRALLAALAPLALAGCGGGLGSALSPAASDTFDLTAPTISGVGAPRGALIVAEPQSLRWLDTDRIVIKPRGNEITYLGGAQWSDRLPRLFQARLVQGFQNARALRTVARPGEGVDAATQLLTEIRAFEIDAGAGNVARVEVVARLVGTRSGRVVAGEVFRAEVPGSTEARAATGALDRAMGDVITRIVRWSARNV